MRQFHSDTHYIDAFFFKGSTVIEHKLYYYLEKEAFQMYQRILNKYVGTENKVLVTLRKVNHELIKSDLVSY